MTPCAELPAVLARVDCPTPGTLEEAKRCQLDDYLVDAVGDQAMLATGGTGALTGRQAASLRPGVE